MKKQKKNKSNLKVKIISGAWKGRNISFLEKRDLRPTKNQIRETLFNWLQNDVKNSVCIDLFAGSGALGFEAASRGAKQVFMVDNDIDIINSLNSQKIKFEASNVDLIHANAEEYIEGHHDEVDIIFLDPPFSDTHFIENLKTIKKDKIYHKDHLIIIHREIKSKDKFENLLNLIDIKKYGRSKIIFCIFK